MADAVPMFERLIALCAERGLEFGVKLTNTFPVDVTRNELLPPRCTCPAEPVPADH